MAADSTLGPGFRFHPTDEELVFYYLKRRVDGKPLRFDPIAVIDVYKSEPWDLPGKSKLHTKDLEWYFFSYLETKYGSGWRSNRATQQGYWKTTGKDRVVRRGDKVVGMKKTLVFHIGRAPRGERTNWVMHEYRLVDFELGRQTTFVLCRVFEKSGSGSKNGEQYGAPFVEDEWEDSDDDKKSLQNKSIDPEEVVADKCNALCTSTDERNPQPSEEELMMHDVKALSLSNVIDDITAGFKGITVRCNGKEIQKSTDIPKLEASRIEGNTNEVENIDVLELSSDGKPSYRVDNGDLKISLAEQNGKMNFDMVVETQKDQPSQVKKECVSADEKTLSRPTSDSCEDEDGTDRIFISKVEEKDKLKSADYFYLSDGTPFKKARAVSLVNQLEEANIKPLAVKSDKSENIVQKKSMVDCDDGNLKASGTAGSAYEAKTKSDLVKDSLKTVNSDGTTSTLLNGTFSESATLPENSLKTDDDIWETTQSESLADSTLGPGFRFHPTDVELVLYYLKRRVTGKPLRFDPISVIDIYKSEPWDLPGQSKLHTTKYLEGYFFSSLETKYDYGWRINRATQHGYWKPTGKDRVVRHVERAVGMKKTLVFHTGRAPRGERTDWVMHEYRLVQEELEKVGLKQATFVLCRVFEKSGPGGKNTEKCGVQMVENELKDGHVLYSKREDNDEKNHQHPSAVQEADPGMCISVCTSSQSHNLQPQCIAECTSSQSHNPQPQCIAECTSSESHNSQPQCIAVCTSTQSHKPQPSEEESGVGDSVIFPKYLAHGEGVQKSCDTPELDASKKEGNLKNLASFEVLQLSLGDKPGDQVAKVDFKASLVEHGQYSRINLASDKVSETNTAHSVSIKECVSADVKILEQPTYDLPKHEGKRGRISTSTAEEQDKFKFANDLGISDGRPSKKAKLDSSVKQIEETSISKVEVKDKLKSANGKLKFANDLGISDGRPSKKAKIDSSVKQIEETSISKVEVKDMLKSAIDFGLSDGRPSKKPSLDNLVKQAEEANFPPLEVEKEKGEEVARKDKSGIVVQNKSTVDCDRYNIKAPGKSGIASKDKIKSKLVQDLLKMVSSDEKKSTVSNSKVFQDAAASRKNLRPGGKTVEITKRQETDSKEFLSYRGRGKPTTIGVKRVVEVNERGFREPCFKNFSSEERDVKAAEIMLLMSGRKTEFRMASHQNC